MDGTSLGESGVAELRAGGGYRNGGVSSVGGNGERMSSIFFPKYQSAGLPISERTERVQRRAQNRPVGLSLFSLSNPPLLLNNLSVFLLILNDPICI